MSISNKDAGKAKWQKFHLGKNRMIKGRFYFLLTLISVWTNNHIPSTVLDEITYPLPNFNLSSIEIREWISNFFPHTRLGPQVYPCNWRGPRRILSQLIWSFLFQTEQWINTLLFGGCGGVTTIRNIHITRLQFGCRGWWYVFRFIQHCRPLLQNAGHARPWNRHTLNFFFILELFC